MIDFRFKTVIFGFALIIGAGALAMEGGYYRPPYPAAMGDSSFSQGQSGSYEEATTAGQTGNAGSVDALEVPMPDFVNISADNHKQIPQKKYAQIALDQSGFGGVVNYSAKPSVGGNGVLYFTNNGLAIKLSAGDRGEDEAEKLQKAAIKIKEIGRIKGFEMNLPEKVYETGNGTNIQILKRVITPVPGDKKDLAGIMRTYMREGNPTYLETMKLVGKKLAEFQLSTRPEYQDGYFVGLQHGDFHPGNLMVTRLNESSGDGDFTLIDNSDFREHGRLISDLVYFFYWSTAELHLQAEFDKRWPKKDTERMKQIIQAFLSGYASTLRDVAPDVLENMKLHFDEEGGPLAAANFAYNKHFKVTRKWEDLSKKILKQAFDEAYKGSSRYVSSPAIEEPRAEFPVPVQEPSQNSRDWSYTQTDDVGSLVSTLSDGERANLTSVNVSHTEVQDARPLRSLINLENLDLSYTPFSAAGHISSLANLRTLNLAGSKIIWVGPLSSLTNLRTLDLSHTEVNWKQSELGKLENLKKLQLLNLTGAHQITAKDIERLRKILPAHCRIISDFSQN